MKRIVYKFISFFVLLTSINTSFAQTQDADALHETGRSFMRQAIFPSALQAFDKALELKPR
jgi:hypothetical protein